MYRKPEKLEQYDIDKLVTAKKLLLDVYNYYGDFPPTKRKMKRLYTIISKLEILLELDSKDGQIL